MKCESPKTGVRLRGFLLWTCVIALVVVFHNFGMPLLPDAHRMFQPAEIKPESPANPASHAYVVSFSGGSGDLENDYRSHADLYEDGTLLGKHASLENIRTVGNGQYRHRDGRVVFSATDNSDPRRNGRDYDIYYPLLYSRAVGYAAVLIFFGAVAGLFAVRLRRAVPDGGAARPPGGFGRHLIASAALLTVGLYCSTGTLSPYANTTFPHVIPPGNYLYNVDHIHFKVLFDFVDGRPKSVWNGAIFIRRILFPILCYPFMKLWGFEIGGTIGSIAINVAGFVVFLLVLRRQVGDRGAALAGWLLALYPGFTYWGGLPYVYSFIVPGSLLLASAVVALQGESRLSRVALVSVLMGIAYLGYDLIAFFLPASLLVLLLHRRKPAAAALSALLQIAPLAIWLACVSLRLHQPLENSNSASVTNVLGSYLHTPDFRYLGQALRAAPDIGLFVFFGSNFLFLPALFLALLAINAATSRIRFQPAELALLGITLALFLFNNLAPNYGGAWQMRGIWIARLYQPVFPVFAYFAARWFQALPPLRRGARFGIASVLLAASAGNFLVVFGPILNDPLHIAEEAFYRFYDHNSDHTVFERELAGFGRRPLGFPAHGK